ncbi:uncharacterized protein THITE_122466 [Thermothielavioides terrestris NRRL 8126]|uniref:Uncharacterized protein n=1 Tax=Thermothielavioides terrestris (strain ATCC 38088 / NRRL 8126) TaxID=578455 RepID=G2RDP5_THETT|nr:uncharacterized protein THITE_122466 [Thermothielavioides terrestris NRRL 8126]AEO70830.1 hypothetical protein THITE_122466 [Thermothielavioides terrestris NRRL 8126]
MESSPLTKAHDHARAAAIATQTSDTAVAITEHAQAAGEFANASRTTTSIEALRTLSLLEQHHRRLSELLKLPVGPPSHTSIDGDIPEEEEEKEGQGHGADPDPAPPPTKEPSVARQTVAPAKAPPSISHTRYPGRNLSSIASNLASARGIRAHYSSQPLSPSVTNDQAPGSVEVHPRRERKEGSSASTKSKAPDQREKARKPTKTPPVVQEDTASEPPASEPTSQPSTDEGFSRFYSAFGSLFNRIPLPLVFSGFPLSPDEPSSPPAPSAPESTPRKSRQKHSVSAAEPDLSKIYSRATLRSLEPDLQGPNDSFYVVPTSGHTASYASILSHERKEKRRLAASIHRSQDDKNTNTGKDNLIDDDNEDDDDFVDARESQQAPGPSLSPNGRPSERELRNVVEELQIENASLKDVLDKLSRRLHAFELNSQSSHLALAQSLRLQRPASPLSSSSAPAAGLDGQAPPAPVGEEALRRRNRELEEQLGEMVKRMASLEKDHLKLQLTLEKYRARWEKLKAGAKARIEAQGLGNDSGARR